ncbi:hypothetical protein TYRP_011109 [Tyrophagus putrescentiae]|nr:hypothetical protein TYRP_011109 [Tyrophagus putrescentiae]
MRHKGLRTTWAGIPHAWAHSFSGTVAPVATGAIVALVWVSMRRTIVVHLPLLPSAVLLGILRIVVPLIAALISRRQSCSGGGPDQNLKCFHSFILVPSFISSPPKAKREAHVERLDKVPPALGNVQQLALLENALVDEGGVNLPKGQVLAVVAVTIIVPTAFHLLEVYFRGVGEQVGGMREDLLGGRRIGVQTDVLAALDLREEVVLRVGVQRRDGARRTEPGVDVHGITIFLFSDGAVLGHLKVPSQFGNLLKEIVLGEVTGLR